MNRIDGMLILYKDAGISSRNSTAFIRRLIGKQTKMGHAGTLDPLAEGVLPVLLGEATKLQDFVCATKKSYQFTVEFGRETPSLDLETEANLFSDRIEFTQSQVLAVLPSLIGIQQQEIPSFSATKIAGRRSYRSAQAGRKTESLSGKSKSIEIYDLQLIELSTPHATFSVSCSMGTYVRTLAKDIAARLGTYATVVKLIRTSSAGFCTNSAVRSQNLESSDQLIQSLIPLSQIPTVLPRVKILCLQEVWKLRSGQIIQLSKDAFLDDEISDKVLSTLKLGLALDCDNRLIGIISVQTNQGSFFCHLKRGLQ